MKSRLVLLALATLSGILQVSAQGTFQNLNFELANVSGYSPRSGNVPTNAAFPGWVAIYATSSSTNPTAVVAYDAISLGGAVISVNDTNTGSGFMPLQGQYSAYLFGGSGVSSTLSQTGLVPAGTQSLQVDVGTMSFPFVVTLGGQTLVMVPLQSFPDYTLYGAAIPQFAGQVEQLNFTEPYVPGETSSFLFDNIQFSPQTIPEPSTWALLALSGGALLLRRRKTA